MGEPAVIIELLENLVLEDPAMEKSKTRPRPRRTSLILRLWLSGTKEGPRPDARGSIATDLRQKESSALSGQGALGDTSG